MSKKKRHSSKGHIHGNTPRSRRPSSVPPSPGASPSAAPSAPSLPSPVAASAAAPTSMASTLISGSGPLPGPSTTRSPSHLVASASAVQSSGVSADVLVGQAAAAVQPIEHEPSVDAVPSRDDDQEESGPRIVAHVPAKAEPKVEKPETRDEDEDADAKKAETAAEPAKDPDEASVPPVVDDDHEHFFAEGEKTDHEHRQARAVAHAPEVEAPDQDEKDLVKMSPAVRERRARYTKYVKWTLAGLSVVCLAAAVRVTMARGHSEPEPAPVAVAAAQLPAPPPEAPQAVAPAPVPVDKPTDKVDPAAQPAAAADPAAAPAPAPAPVDTAPAAPAETELDPIAAKQQRVLATKALDKNDLKTAIEAGEQSIALDPTEAQAYLIVGAAYQMKGKMADARRVFTDCTKQAKKGSIGECRAMLR